MDCIYINAPGEVEIRQEAMPVPKRDEALLKLLYGGLCGSDLGTYRGTFAYADYPRIPGHEFAAEIVDIGDNDQGLSKGMIVTANPYFNCGTCYSCRRGMVNCCMSNETMGAQRDGAFRQYITMPIARLYDGKGIPARTLALIEPFCISYHGIKKAGIKSGEKVLIIGAGTIGTLAAAAANFYGAEVYISDISEQKLKLAKEWGVAGTILNSSKTCFQQQVDERTQGNGFDTVVEAVGLPRTFQDSVDAAAFGGRVVLIGVGNENLDFNFTQIQKKELRIFGSRNAMPGDFSELIELVGERHIPLDKIVTNIYPYKEAADAFREFDEHSSQMLKVLLKF